ncbi:peptide chain release factor N(5)-glutamine methyltransferase [Planctomicrobium sp. SH664]|uniref:peptide chain release factor N(5)-glutamine methyltransferase n=1 Tax=Planctomicrobium sp. SH664 TaxID=3448125 RepID=UPI003F5BCF7A
MAQPAVTTEEPWTVRRILDWTIQFLKDKGSDTPRLDAEVLLAHARQCQRIQLYTQFDEPLTDAQRATMRELVKRRGAAEPVAYLVGHREFFSLDFIVRRGVLIPRPDTEVLVLTALDLARGNNVAKILDIATGTACVPIAIAKNLPPVSLQAVEIDPTAHEVAAANIEKHGLTERIQLHQGDLFAPLDPSDRFGIITSNPPYVASREIAELAPDIRNHEPHLALDGGEDGLEIVRRLIHAAPAHLAENGWLLIELSPEQAEAGCELLRQRGFTAVSVKNDLSGQARVVLGRWPGVR